jgi:hypothetical protein
LTWVAEPSCPSEKNPEASKSKSSSHDSSVAAGIVKTVLENDDLYQILGVPRHAGALDKMMLRRAYLARSRACHPECVLLRIGLYLLKSSRSCCSKFPDNPDATRAFQKVAVAYDVLSTPNLKRLYDNRPPPSATSSQDEFDVFAFAARPSGHAEETFRGVVLGVFNDFLDGDLEVIRGLLSAVNDINPSIKLGDEGINSVLVTLQAIRERALTCRTCIYALHAQITRLLELQHAFRQLSYFDVLGRSRITIQLTRITLSLPIELERALQEQHAYEYGTREDENSEKPKERLFPRHVTLLIRGVDGALERMERILK